MTIYEALQKDHSKVKQLLNELLSLSDDDNSQKDFLVNKIRDEIIPHSRAEESIFYNSLRQIDSAKKEAMHGYKEHMEAETLLRSLQMKSSMNGNWRVTAQKLKDALEHHIEEEETEMFALGRENFSDEEAQMMARAFEQMKPQIKEEGIIGTTVDMISNLMPPRFSNSFRSEVTSHKS